ncbi:response regulator transcription factor [Variovorax sp. NFACC27]|uniref:response regulator transcription factor n=1 Tax=unclassified Variovorax TaxID=663243 RepID=UPI000899C4E1|nr:two component transcriptional regulator, LuxR family [Variovorax sp. NFACC28]SEG92394.1 two component transcriptional regulator, LuxR family [Variovorax sp. NFACC29]SFD64554.1 two component transcriptional regulator, LuxR family [Variovorax sp. NFACC26]SFG98690.1 two component transcriptional regulator, LuxR family [Variovorax sp. NFACC27]
MPPFDSSPAPLSPAAETGTAARTPRAILVVDDHDLLRLGVCALVQAQASPSGASIEVFEASNVADALRLYEAHQASIGLVLLDLALPDTHGLSGLAEFRMRFPDARIVVLSGTGNSTLAQGVLALGAAAFLPKSADLKEVVSFIRACGLLDGGADASSQQQQAAPSQPVPRALTGYAEFAHASAWQELTPRQMQVLQWVLEGKANKEIAQLANLSEGTVKNHVSTILLLFGMRSRAQLISTLH